MVKQYKEWSNPLTAFNSLKILFHADHLRKIASGEFPPPITCDTDGTNACNQKCFFCNSKKYRESSGFSSMSSEHLMRLADFYAEWGIQSTCIGGGGESTINPAIKQFIPKVRKNGLEVGLITNGTLLDNDYARIVNDNCRFLGVSCDAATEITYEKIRGTNDLKKVRKNLEKINSIRINKKTGLDTNIKFLINQFNYDEIFKAAKIAKELGCCGIHIRPVAIDNIPGLEKFIKDGPFNLEQYLERINDQISKAFDELEDENFSVFAIKHKFGDRMERVIEFNKCRATPINLTFAADGWAYVCFNMRGQKNMRLAKHDPDPNDILSVWGTEKHKELLEVIDPIDCPRCTYTRYHQVIEQAIEKDCMFYMFP